MRTGSFRFGFFTCRADCSAACFWISSIRSWSRRLSRPKKPGGLVGAGCPFGEPPFGGSPAGVPVSSPGLTDGFGMNCRSMIPHPVLTMNYRASPAATL